jgi:hypothetical protein
VRDSFCLLRPGGERRGERTSQRGQQKAAAVHGGMVGQAKVWVNVEFPASAESTECHRIWTLTLSPSRPILALCCSPSWPTSSGRHRRCGRLTGDATERVAFDY